MQATPRRDTPAELALRRELHRRGLRYSLHQKLLPGLRRETDIAFPRVRVAVFVDGCFWHACPEHGTTPKSNRGWWQAKLEANRSRDRDTDQRLRAEGWQVVRIWEHEPPVEAADRIEPLVREH
jgi:DNA mismatch endonuclease, patch repair protein